MVSSRAGRLAAELARVAGGGSAVAPGAKDRRFADPAWSANPVLRRVMQAYLATGSSALGLVEDLPLDWRDAALAAYRDESREMLRATERERSALVEVILTGGTAKGTLWEVAGTLRLPLDGAFLVIAAEAAGAELYCHPNTVRYRLRRIESGTGRSLASPGQVAELVTAVRAWRELPHA